MLASRIVWMATGGLWAGRSMLEFADPDYWDPVTALDWSAVWMFSAALALIILGAFCGVSLAPQWFQATSPAPATDISDSDSGGER